MKKLLAVLTAVFMFTLAASAHFASSIELPDMPLYPEDNTPECNVTTPENYIYKFTFTVKSAQASELAAVLSEQYLEGYGPSDTVYYIDVRLDDEQYRQICDECEGDVYLCNIALNGELLPADAVFSYKSTLDIKHQFQILMPEEPSVLTVDYFGELSVMMFYQNDTLDNGVAFVGPYSELELPYPEVDGKKPYGWNSMPDGSGIPYTDTLVYTPESGKLWIKDDNIISIYAIWEEYTPVLQGDVNEDGEIDNKDVVALFRLVSGDGVEYSFRCDFNNDGEVDNKDVVTLFRYVSSI